MTRYATFLSFLLVTNVSYGQLDLNASDSIMHTLSDSFPTKINYFDVMDDPGEIVGGTTIPPILPVYKRCRNESDTNIEACIITEVSDFVSKKIKFPKELEDSTFSAKVYVSMVIDENALVTRIRIERSSIRDLPETMKSQAHLLDNEAIRVVSKLKFIEPPMIGTKPTRMKLTIPINYSTSGK